MGLLNAARRLRIQLAVESLERFGRNHALKVLDAGCGEGLLSEALGRRHPGWEVVGVDLHEEQLDKARASVARQGLANVRFVQADLTKELGDSTYDAVAAIECLSEIPDDELALSSMARALGSGGLFLAQVPEENWEPVLRSGRRTWRQAVRHGYSPQALIAKCERAGLTRAMVTPTARGTVWLAQDVAIRLTPTSLKRRLLAYPPLTTAVHLERWGITWGKSRALFVEARRP